MPTTRKRKVRTRTGSSASVPSEIFEALKSGFGPLLPVGRQWLETHSDKEVLRAWRKYRKAILRRDLSQNCEWQKPARRPWLYMQELEEKFPRLVVERTEYFPPWGPEGPPKEPEVEEILETDAEYLARLGKLEKWEVEIIETWSTEKPHLNIENEEP